MVVTERVRGRQKANLVPGFVQLGVDVMFNYEDDLSDLTFFWIFRRCNDNPVSFFFLFCFQSTLSFLQPLPCSVPCPGLPALSTPSRHLLLFLLLLVLLFSLLSLFLLLLFHQAPPTPPSPDSSPFQQPRLTNTAAQTCSPLSLSPSQLHQNQPCVSFQSQSLKVRLFFFAYSFPLEEGHSGVIHTKRNCLCC